MKMKNPSHEKITRAVRRVGFRDGFPGVPGDFFIHVGVLNMCARRVIIKVEPQLKHEVFAFFGVVPVHKHLV